MQAAAQCGSAGGADNKACKSQVLTPYAHHAHNAHMSPKRAFNITLEPRQIETLRQIRELGGPSPSESISRALRAYLPNALVVAKDDNNRKLAAMENAIEQLKRDLGDKKKTERSRGTTRKRS